jgi:hypothetical protein
MIKQKKRTAKRFANRKSNARAKVPPGPQNVPQFPMAREYLGFDPELASRSDSCMASILRYLAGDVSGRQLGNAIERISQDEARSLSDNIAYAAAHGTDKTIFEWNDSRFTDAMNLARNAAMLNFCLLDDDTRGVLIRRTATLRQALPSVVRDAVELANNTRQAFRSTSLVAEQVARLQAEEGVA